MYTEASKQPYAEMLLNDCIQYTYIIVPCCTWLPIIIISHMSINFEQKCWGVVSWSVDKLSHNLSTSCLKNVLTNCSVDQLSWFRKRHMFYSDLKQIYFIKNNSNDWFP